MSRQSILIAINNFLLKEGVQSFIRQTNNFTIKGVVGSKVELAQFLQCNSVDLVMIDYDSMDFDSPKEIMDFRSLNIDFNILLLANGMSHQSLTNLTAIGIKCIVAKYADEEELMLAIDRALMGKQYFSELYLDLLIEKVNRPVFENNSLTTTEIEIVRLIADGLTTKQIANQKHISYHTVMTHRKNIFRKLKVSNVSELMLHAIKAGWIDNIEYYI